MARARRHGYSGGKTKKIYRPNAVCPSFENETCRGKDKNRKKKSNTNVAKIGGTYVSTGEFDSTRVVSEIFVNYIYHVRVVVR